MARNITAGLGGGPDSDAMSELEDKVHLERHSRIREFVAPVHSAKGGYQPTAPLERGGFNITPPYVADPFDNGVAELGNKARVRSRKPSKEPSESWSWFREIRTRFHNLSNRARVILGIIIILTLAGAVVGGVAGGLLPKNKQLGTVTTSNILSSSKLAATKWTDEKGNPVYTVYFQNLNGHLMMSQWAGVTKFWNVTNIRAALGASSESILPRNGTAIAVDHSPTGDSANLRFLNDAEHLDFVVGGRDGRWKLGDRTNLGAVAAPGSQIAALSDGCTSNCTNSSIILYQSEQQVVMTLRHKFATTSWDTYSWDQSVVKDVDSPLAIVPFRPDNSVSTDPVGQRVYMGINGRLVESVRNGSDAFAPFNRGQEFPLADPGSTEPYKSPWLSATSWASSPSAGLQNVLLALLFKNGSVVVHWYDQGKGAWLQGNPAVANVSAMAVHDGMRAYCVQQGVLREYLIDQSDPQRWTLNGNVTTTVGTGGNK
ncbi:hypothetical protein B0H63DRAFT_557093 [Podospora didyma]|uniref:Fucose-specific lectin n=1 Tax=Podospora didyma TaxID=330526 RepID=A0AAE0U4C5_9PEZI|nr:hypothetical protein B0H63DRAFT_557093 [Podospora didyma]